MSLLITAALVPAIVLMCYVYNKDKIEKEPFGLILRLFLFGALSTVAAMATSFLISDGKSGRVGRSIKREARIALSLGRPSRRIKLPGMRPTE